MSAVSVLLMVSSLGQVVDDESAYLISYKGRLTPVTVSDGKAVTKGFEVVWFLPGAASTDALAVVAEDTFAVPWPARFAFDSPKGEGKTPEIGYRFGERDYTVALPKPSLKVAEQLSRDGEAVDGALRYTVTGQEMIDDRECILIEAKTNFGRDRVLAIEKISGFVVRYEETVFLGRGDRFLLTLEMERVEQPTEDRTAAMRKSADSLKEIESIVDKEEGSHYQDLSPDSLSKIVDLQEELETQSRDTPFAGLAAAIAENVKEQQERAEGVDGIAKRVTGSPAPPIEMNDIEGGRFDASASKGKVVVLHFWEYDNDSLVAPYGQVGFLDFLARKRGSEQVSVMGVAVNAAFSDSSTRLKPARSAKTLAEFMNLGFPILSDDGTFLRSLGDPREVGAELPLWVVIDQKGIVRSYKSGLYQANANEGLKELDEVVAKLLAEQNEPVN